LRHPGTSESHDPDKFCKQLFKKKQDYKIFEARKNFKRYIITCSMLERPKLIEVACDDPG
jgi:hypothetical protein